MILRFAVDGLVLVADVAPADVCSLFVVFCLR